MWIWQHQDWPVFQYDIQRYLPAIEQYYRRSVELIGQIENLSEETKTDTWLNLIVSEAIKTSAIEGEKIDRESVRESFKQLAGLSVNDARIPLRKIDNIKAKQIALLLIDANRKWNKSLSHKTLKCWQEWIVDVSFLNQNIRGEYRISAMSVGDGRVGSQKIYYDAPPADQVQTEMKHFLAWYNRTNPLKNSNKNSIPSPIRAGIAHLWFEAIHPFDDGNGRVGRAIADHALSQGIGRPTITCLATAIEQDKETYYNALESTTKNRTVNINPWLDYFFDALNTAQNVTQNIVGFVVAKTRLYDQFKDKMNPRQHKAIARMLEEGLDGFEGGMSAKKYESITDCSKATATRDLIHLLDLGVFYALPGAGRNRRYALNIGTGKGDPSKSNT